MLSKPRYLYPLLSIKPRLFAVLLVQFHFSYVWSHTSYQFESLFCEEMAYNDTKMSGMGASGNPPPYSEAHRPPPPIVVGPQPVAVMHTTIGATVVPVVVGQPMGPNPATIVCKSCNYQIVTRVEMKPTMRTHLFAALLCIIGCWPCAFIPYCTDSCNNADHYCPNCSAYIGSYMN